MGPIHLARLDPFDDLALAEVLALETAASAVDRPYDPPPTPTASRAFRRYGWDGEPGDEWLHHDGAGRLTGTIHAYLPERENQHAAVCGVLVHPEHRRDGLGRRLYERLEEMVRRSGRRVLIGRSLDASAQRAFVEGLGFTLAGVKLFLRQDLGALDWDLIDRLRTEARQAAGDYTLVRLDGPVPEEQVEQVAAMEAAINDAPRDNLDIEGFLVTAARIRARERSVAEAGLRHYRLVARRQRDGRLAGHTVVYVDPEQPRYGRQEDTSVLAEHRGHRLGMLLKSEMMFLLAGAEPDLRWIDTGNAESNHHMIAINEALGYRVKARYLGWQRDL
jgi:GNAT superfamily N-acetyltransferase